MDENKIYVVIAVLLIILLGLAFYLFYLDKKIKSVEERMAELKTKETDTP